jgi:hypothetical protein
MVEPPGPQEMELARLRINRLTSEFTRKRTSSLLLAITFVALGGLAFGYSQPMLAFNSLVISLLFVLRCLDSHGMVQDVRRRSTKTLFPRMAMFERPAAKPTTDPGR